MDSIRDISRYSFKEVYCYLVRGETCSPGSRSERCVHINVTVIYVTFCVTNY